MFEKISWEIFEKTGDIDAYLLYIDLKKLGCVKVKDNCIENANDSNLCSN